jgi:hypothetical protein
MVPTAPVYAWNGPLYRVGWVEYQHNPCALRDTILTAVARGPSGYLCRSRAGGSPVRAAAPRIDATSLGSGVARERYATRDGSGTGSPYCRGTHAQRWRRGEGLPHPAAPLS